MKQTVIILAILALALAPALGLAADKNEKKDQPAAPAASPAAAPAAPIDPQKLSYALGMEIGGSLKNLETTIDLKAFSKAIEDVMGGKQTQLTKPEAEQVRNDFFKKLQADHAKKMQELGVKNKAEGEKFLADNKSKKGVVTTASGLQYIVLQDAKGPKPTADDKVTVNYKGTLIDGKVFDSSYDRKEPVTFPVKGVIPGWTEALQLMPVGSKYKLFIPAALGYGDRGAGQDIGPNAVLIFEVELLKIEPKEDPAKKPAALPPGHP